ncbi:hypothetical protein [Haloarcula brevis]|uniref:hypothetical protein n=1 Tax=Haloarcula brevis TaxID=3111453 RepID=UPI00300F6C91
MAKEKLDLLSDNDLMVATKTQFGNEPPVQRLHYFAHNVEPGWEGEFFHRTMLSVRDLTDSLLSLRVQVYDIDGIDPKYIKTVGELAPKAAVMFPIISPYAALAGLAGPPLAALVNNIDNHEPIVDERVNLEMAESGTARNLLQPGYFVCFDGQSPANPHLRSDLRVTDGNGDVVDRNYAVLEVSRNHQQRREFEINYKIAKLLGELGGKGQTTRDPIHYLGPTLEGYDAFRKLQRVQELEAKDDLTDAEANLLTELKEIESIKPFLTD